MFLISDPKATESASATTDINLARLKIKRRKRRSWLASEKYRAVELVVTRKGAVSDVAAANEIDTAVLQSWVKRAYEGAVLGLHRWYLNSEKQALLAELEFYKREYAKSQEAGSEIWGDYLQLVRG